MAKQIELLSLADISPPSLLNDKNILAIIAALDPQMQSVSRDVRETLIFSRIDELPESVIDLLAWQWHVDFYESAHSLDAKRAMVKSSISWHRKKGTRAAIVEALDMLGLVTRFTAWHELLDEGAQPYTFEIDALITPEFWKRVDWTKPTQTIRRVVQESKATRSWMSKLFVHIDDTAQQDIAIGAAVIPGIRHDIEIDQKTQSDTECNITVGIATLQSYSHNVAIEQHTHSATELEVIAGAVAVQGIHHESGIKQSTGSSAQLGLTIGTAMLQSPRHILSIDQQTHAECDLPLSVGVGLVQGVQHKAQLNQPTHAEISGSISTGANVIQGIQHKATFIQQTHSLTATSIYTGGAVCSYVYIEIPTAA